MKCGNPDLDDGVLPEFANFDHVANHAITVYSKRDHCCFRDCFAVVNSQIAPLRESTISCRCGLPVPLRYRRTRGARQARATGLLLAAPVRVQSAVRGCVRV